MKHLAVLSIPSWSHSRPLVIWVASLILHDPTLHITHFIPSEIKEKTQKLLAKFPLEGTERRLRIVWLEIADPNASINAGAAVAHGLQHCYEPLLAGKAFDGHEALPAPGALLTDMLGHGFLDAAKQKGFAGPTLLWMPSESTAIAGVLSSIGHFMATGGDTNAAVEAIGLLPRYRYEFQCTTMFLSSPVEHMPEMLKGWYRSMTGGEHHVIGTFSTRLVPDAAIKWHDVIPKTSLSIVSMMYEPSFWQPVTDYPTDDPLFAWLDRQPERSVVFISFGSVFFPSTHPWEVDVLLQALTDAGFRYVLLTGTTMAAQMPDLDKLRRDVNASGNIAPGWIDQARALSRKAISLVLYQGGPGGAIESLRFGLPSIAWPFMADQGPIADLMANQLDVAWEVWQIRDRLVGRKIASKPGYEVIHTPESVRAELDGILRAVKGEEGRRKRANAEKASAILLEEHEKQAGKQMDDFLRLAFV